jgi:hypothetical protein
MLDIFLLVLLVDLLFHSELFESMPTKCSANLIACYDSEQLSLERVATWIWEYLNRCFQTAILWI